MNKNINTMPKNPSVLWQSNGGGAVLAEGSGM